MYCLTGKIPLIDKEIGEFLDLDGVFQPIFQCINSTTTFNLFYFFGRVPFVIFSKTFRKIPPQKMSIIQTTARKIMYLRIMFEN